MEKVEELDRNAHLRAQAVQPMVDELRYMNRQMEDVLSLLFQHADRLHKVTLWMAKKKRIWVCASEKIANGRTDSAAVIHSQCSSATSDTEMDVSSLG